MMIRNSWPLFIVLLLAACTGTRRTANSEVLRVLTYNVRHCNVPGTGASIDVPRFARVIRASGADVAAVQEVDVNTRRSLGQDEARLLARHSGLRHYYFAKTIDWEGGDYGVLVLSRWPLRAPHRVLLPVVLDGKAEQRALAVADIQTPRGRRFTFYATHLDASNQDLRRQQTRFIDSLAARSSQPVILAGDLNASPDNDALTTLTPRLRNSCDPCGFTYPGNRPTKTIDYIYFSTSRFAVRRHTVLPDTSSDHRAVLAELTWQ